MLSIRAFRRRWRRLPKTVHLGRCPHRVGLLLTHHERIAGMVCCRGRSTGARWASPSSVFLLRWLLGRRGGGFGGPGRTLLILMHHVLIRHHAGVSSIIKRRKWPSRQRNRACSGWPCWVMSRRMVTGLGIFGRIRWLTRWGFSTASVGRSAPLCRRSATGPTVRFRLLLLLRLGGMASTLLLRRRPWLRTRRRPSRR